MKKYSIAKIKDVIFYTLPYILIIGSVIPYIIIINTSCKKTEQTKEVGKPNLDPLVKVSTIKGHDVYTATYGFSVHIMAECNHPKCKKMTIQALQ